MDTPMNHAIRIHETGGPEKMVWEEVPLPAPKPGEALVRHKAVGLNYIDVYFRTGLYKAPSMPAIIGMEASGIVEAIGEGVTEVKIGDRVAYATGPIGAYAEARTIKADRLVKMPDAISFEQGAAMMLQGMLRCQGGSDRADPCRCRRRWPHSQPMGRAPWLHRHWRCQHAGKGCAREATRRGPRAAHQR
jgi:D-arabinose 1-dehydrogenase-like Zn-dependent alcohol dehydrogenase